MYDILNSFFSPLHFLYDTNSKGTLELTCKKEQSQES